MSDITMCKDNNCTQKESCKRFTSQQSEYQSYFINTPRTEKGCELYLGEQSEFIMNQLSDIVNGNKK